MFWSARREMTSEKCRRITSTKPKAIANSADGAQAMLDLRAVYLNGEWEAFWSYHVEQEDDRLYRKLRQTG